jgi:hypothetical protein
LTYKLKILERFAQAITAVYGWRQQVANLLDDRFGALQQIVKKILRKAGVAF